MIRTRIAPSPTGHFHIGTARTALFNYLYARKHGGEFVVRIEDTDKERSKPEYEADINEQLEWLGLAADETYRQSERVEAHTAAIQSMLERDTAYVSKEEAKDGSGREVEVVRLRNPGTTVTFRDLIRGDITFDTAELGDFVIARSTVDPLYHLAVVVDDAYSEISHVIRGEDHISNTPRQILIQRALELPQPAYAHLPLILAADRSKLSKRRHAVSIADFRAKGYLSEALVNYLALLGWHPAGDEEVLSLEEVIARFELEDVQKGGAIFDEEKLRWLNRQYLLKYPPERLTGMIADALQDALAAQLPGFSEERALKVAPLVFERVSTLEDVRLLAEEGEVSFFFMKPELEYEKLMWKNTSADATRAHLEEMQKILEHSPDSAFASPEAVKSVLWPYAEQAGRGEVLWPLRYALTGREKSPDPFTVASIIGKEETLERIRAAQAQLQ